MRKITLALAAAAVVATPMLVTASAEASVPTPGCADRVEWSQVHKGMTRGQVRRLTGITGWTETLKANHTVVSYTRCDVLSGPRPVVLYSTLHDDGYGGSYTSRFQTVESWSDWQGIAHY